MILGDVQAVHTRQLWEHFIAGKPINSESLPDYVYRSWETCRDNGVNPRQTLEAHTLSKVEIDKLLKLNNELIEISRPVLEMILFSTNDAKFIVMLTSQEGVILYVTGDLESLSVQENYYNKPGVYCEKKFFSARATTLSLIEKRPISLCGSEHYLEVFHNSLCYAAPIFDHDGNVIACISLATSLNNYNKKTLSMVAAAAENITLQLQRQHLYESKKYLSSLVYSICESLPDGVIALNKANAITYVNHTAEDIFRSTSTELVGKNITEIIDNSSILELSSLIESKKKNIMSLSLKNNAESKWLCRAQPLNDANNTTIGVTLFLASEKQIVQGLTQVGGNRAHYRLEDIKGQSPELEKCLQLAKKIANKASRVLITGESGTGKELFAQGIHNAGPRRAQPFVAISCASIPRDLIEAELFGYVAGAFTGANKNGAMGKFELAHNGTLFLDEIGSLPMEAQGKLLRALQQNEIIRIGGKVPIPVNVNVISANNVDLHELVKMRVFREDLLYRLNSIEIYIPPLRDRKGDTEYLIRYFVESLCKVQNRQVEISAGWMESMLRHYWRGNVRELEHACETAMILCDENILTKRHLPQSVRCTPEDETHEIIKKEYESLDENFKKWLLQAIETHNGNLSEIAKINKISRSTLHRKIKELNIDVKSFRAKST
ncbi:sigma-54-dependent Fis family transcriptional regulator [Pseudogulbenkiania sp. MAI-1]|uniref:sigma-54-dependent Fis family transcriptional regulator n=1 Tax=Pseudogulbenkiania sp. MAI-1 TaxID=990370 RepID=UPI0004B756D1|nr:sigma 54-interacting transcriptional regulator [Pseudogulbenkiania sp. MAI-1]